MLRSVVKLSYCHGFGTFIWFGAVEHPTPQSARTMLVVQHTDQKGSSQRYMHVYIYTHTHIQTRIHTTHTVIHKDIYIYLLHILSNYVCINTYYIYVCVCVCM